MAFVSMGTFTALRNRLDFGCACMGAVPDVSLPSFTRVAIRDD
jgi:hypothetical protein